VPSEIDDEAEHAGLQQSRHCWPFLTHNAMYFAMVDPSWRPETDGAACAENHE